MILEKEQIRKLILEKNMISDYIDLDIQLQVNGFDLTVKDFFHWRDYGKIDFDNKKREIASITPIKLSNLNPYYWDLKQGAYLFQVNETVNLPKNICALSAQRSSLMRNGVISHVGLWDCGYNGQGFSSLNVINPDGIIIYENARVITLWFFTSEDTEGYNGQFQHEGNKTTVFHLSVGE